MATTTDIISIIIATQGNAFLTKAREVDFRRFESLVKVGFVSGVEQLATLRFVPRTDDKNELDAADWLEILRESGARGFRLTDQRNLTPTPSGFAKDRGPLEPRLAHAFAGSPGLLVGVIWSETAEIYESIVLFPRRTASAPRYRFVAQQHLSLSPIQGDVGAQSARLGATLRSIQSYASGRGLSSWAKIFQRCLDLLDGGIPERDMPEPCKSAGLTSAGSRLLAAAIEADVFGGMGSWNDIAPEDSQYTLLSDALFAEIYPSIEIAVNSFWSLHHL
jgi:hypothetical protein